MSKFHYAGQKIKAKQIGGNRKNESRSIQKLLQKMQAAQKQPSNRRNFGQWMTLRRGVCLLGLVGLSGMAYLSYTPLARSNQQSSIINSSVQGQNYHLAPSSPSRTATQIDDVTPKQKTIMHSNPRRFATNLPLFNSQFSWLDET